MIIFLGDKKLGDNGVGDNGLGDSWLGDNGNRPQDVVLSTSFMVEKDIMIFFTESDF